MDRTSNDRKQLESILRESLLEISQDGTDSLHQVVSEVISEVVMPIEDNRDEGKASFETGKYFNKF